MPVEVTEHTQHADDLSRVVVIFADRLPVTKVIDDIVVACDVAEFARARAAAHRAGVHDRRPRGGAGLSRLTNARFSGVSLPAASPLVAGSHKRLSIEGDNEHGK